MIARRSANGGNRRYLNATRTLRTGALAVALLVCVAPAFAGGDWPRMAPWESTVAVPDADRPQVRLAIPDADGHVAYVLDCGNFDTQDPAFDYSGDFECRLMSAVPDTRYSTLLTENPDQTRDWESRGRFFVEDLQGACAADPILGARRAFELRGMVLRLAVEDVHTRLVDGRTRLASLQLHVSVVPGGVQSPIALATGFAEPTLALPGLDLPRPCAASRPETATR
jgi:hypothetical protein